MKITKVLSALLIISTILLLAACNATSKYEQAKASNSITAYEEFLDKNPKSKYAGPAGQELDELYEERDWGKAQTDNTLEGYGEYLTTYPSGKFTVQARENIDNLTRKAWEQALNANTIEGYENFRKTCPASKFDGNAIDRIEIIREEEAWNQSVEIGTIKGYEDFLSNYPDGAHQPDARDNLFELQVVKPIWEKVSEENTPAAYQEFLKSYPNSTYSSMAELKLKDLEGLAWNVAMQENTLEAYNSFLQEFPDGVYSEEVQKRIVDLEVDAIFSGDYGKMPSMNRSYAGDGYSNENEIEIYNNTSYNLTVYYSGPESKKITMVPKETIRTKLVNGNYRVAASVDASGIGNYAGKEKLEGGYYDIEYYIVTRYY